MADQQNADIVYNAQLDAFTLYHIVQEEAGKSSSLSGGPVLPALGHAIAGSAATAATKLLLYPLDLVITRLQVQKQLSGPKEAPSAAKDGDAEYDNLIDAARKIYDAEGGLKAFYTGLAPDVVKGLGDSFLFFLVYNYLRQRETKKFSNTLPVSRELGIGIAAGAFSRFVTTPLQNVITRQQTAALIAARDPTSTTTPAQSGGLSVKDVALQIRSERGLKGFWAGYSASVVLTLNPAITFAIDNLLHRLMPKARRDNPSPQLTFLIAATSKAIATAITYPVSLAKSRAQVSTPAAPQDPQTTAEKDSDSDDTHIVSPPSHPTTPASTPLRHKATSTLHRLLRLLSAQYAILISLRKIHRAEGLRGLYSGLEAEVLKGFLSHGLTMMMKDRVHVGVIQLYYLLLKVTRRWPQEVREVRDEAVRKVGGVRERVEGEMERVGEGVREGVEGVVEGGRRVVWGEKKEGK